MTDSQSDNSREFIPQPLDTNRHDQTSNIIAEQGLTYGTKRPEADIGTSIDARNEAIKDRIDDAVPKGPKRADPSSGGRVMVGEEGDLHDLAAKRQS